MPINFKIIIKQSNVGHNLNYLPYFYYNLLGILLNISEYNEFSPNISSWWSHGFRKMS